jgi:DNA topoisomerase VI subunit B
LDGERRWPAVDPSWQKWLPSRPTCIHWYDRERFGRLVAGYISYDRDRAQDRTVRQFIAEFDGLTGSAKQKLVLEATGLTRTNLSQLALEDRLNDKLLEQLLDAMKVNTRPVKPPALGLIGEKNVKTGFSVLGCKLETFRYKRRFGETEGIPWVHEIAFAYRPDRERRLIVGVNWSAQIINPIRELGHYGHSLDSVLQQLRLGRDEPVVVLLHIACPRVEFTDRGKSAVVLRGPAYKADADEDWDEDGEED